MRMHNDMSYTNSDLIQRGLVSAVPFQVRLDRFYDEAEREANKVFHDTHTDDEWVARCDEARERIGAEIVKIVDLIAEHFTIGQYKDRGGKYPNYDLWFWCNNLHNTTCGNKSGRDYSYVTLTICNGKSAENGNRIFDTIRELLANYDAKNVEAIFQYSQVSNESAVEAEAKRIYEACAGKYIKYAGLWLGKLDFSEKYGYTFRKKYAKKVSMIDAFDICVNVEVAA